MFLLSAALALAMQTSAQRAVVLQVTGGPGTCTVSLDGIELSDVELDRRGRAWAAEDGTVRLENARDTPFRCIGSVLFRLQKVGLWTVGFLSEPGAVHLTILPRCRIWVDARRVALRDLPPIARRWARDDIEIHFQPSPRARFQCVDAVLSVLKKANLAKLGFIGNEQAAPENAQ